MPLPEPKRRSPSSTTRTILFSIDVYVTMCISVVTARAVNFFTLCVNCSHIYIIILETLPINEVEVAESLFFSFWRRVEDKSQDSGLEFIKLKGTQDGDSERPATRSCVSCSSAARI
jgi:hypothetical protein